MELPLLIHVSEFRTGCKWDYIFYTCGFIRPVLVTTGGEIPLLQDGDSVTSRDTSAGAARRQKECGIHRPFGKLSHVGFLKCAYPQNHPFLDGIFHEL